MDRCQYPILVVYLSQGGAARGSLLAVRPGAGAVELPPIQASGEGPVVRFLPNGKGLVYVWNSGATLDFWMLDLTTRKTRQLTRLNSRTSTRNFDTDGKQIVFDRVRENSDIQLIDLRPTQK